MKDSSPSNFAFFVGGPFSADDDVVDLSALPFVFFDRCSSSFPDVTRLPLDDEDAMEEEAVDDLFALAADDNANDDFATTRIIEAVDDEDNSDDSASSSMTLQNFNLTSSPTAVSLTLLPR